MRKIGLFLLICLLSITSYAGGGITHMLLAQEIIEQIPDASLRNLLKDNFEAYQVGAYYPDSGFVGNNRYGEESHWDPFIYTFADYIKEKYPNPELQNPKLVAFLFGCAVHRLTDEVIHWTFYPVMAHKDFSGNWNTDGTHTYGDAGIDLLLIVDRNQWFTHPRHWWVPVNDLLQVYHRMGKDEYTSAEIIWGNAVLSLANYSERLIAAPAYPYLKLRMPWTAQHYYDWPEGGLLVNEKKTADYLMNLWARLKNPAADSPRLSQKLRTVHSYPEQYSLLHDFAHRLLRLEMAHVAVETHADGSVELAMPVIISPVEFNQALTELLRKF